MPKPAFVSSRSRTCCDSEVNYTENTQKNVLTCDLANNEIQLDLLGDKNQDIPHISRMVTQGSRRWWFDGFVFAVAHGFSVVCLATVVTDCAIDVAVGAVFIEGAL